MRQKWLAEWETERGDIRYEFVSLDKKEVARIHFKLEMGHLKYPVPEKYALKRVGKPYALKPSSYGWSSIRPFRSNRG